METVPIKKSHLVVTMSALALFTSLSVGSVLWYDRNLRRQQEEHETVVALLNESNAALQSTNSALVETNGALALSKEELSDRLEKAKIALKNSEIEAVETLLGGSTKKFPLEKSRIEVHDGDTIRYLLSSGQSEPVYVGIRLAAIDTPEYKYRRKYDQYGTGKLSHVNFGQKAADFLQDIIRNSNEISIVYAGPGLFGRAEAYIFADGNMVEVLLVRGRLAYASILPKDAKQFPGYSAEILSAASVVKAPDFLSPKEWRKNYKALAAAK